MKIMVHVVVFEKK